MNVIAGRAARGAPDGVAASGAPRAGAVLRMGWAAAAVLVLGACGDSTGPGPYPEPRDVAVVLNSVERSLTIFPLDDAGEAFTVGLAPEGTPVGVVAHGGVAVVPMGTYPVAVVVDLATRAVRHTVALPAGSGATGAAFLNDSIVLVGNPELNSVTPVNVRRGTAGAAIPTGRYPQRIVVAGGEAFVINAELENFAPVRPGTITVIDGRLQVVDSIQLGGTNSGSAVVGPDGRVYVVNAGSFGMGNGSLSVVDPATRTEVSHHAGFGDFPGSVAADDGRVLVTVYGLGILEWDPDGAAFVHGPDDPLGTPPIADLAFDARGDLWVVNPGACAEPGSVYRFGTDLRVETGICPFAVVFDEVG